MRAGERSQKLRFSRRRLIKCEILFRGDRRKGCKGCRRLSIKAPDGIEEWEPFFNRKMNRKIENYKFWDLLALYISSNTLSSLPWTIPFGDVEIEVMKKQANDILDWYDGMKNTVPKWYAGF